MSIENAYHMPKQRLTQYHIDPLTSEIEYNQASRHSYDRQSNYSVQPSDAANQTDLKIDKPEVKDDAVSIPQTTPHIQANLSHDQMAIKSPVQSRQQASAGSRERDESPSRRRPPGHMSDSHLPTFILESPYVITGIPAEFSTVKHEKESMTTFDTVGKLLGDLKGYQKSQSKKKADLNDFLSCFRQSLMPGDENLIEPEDKNSIKHSEKDGSNQTYLKAFEHVQEVRNVNIDIGVEKDTISEKPVDRNHKRVSFGPAKQIDKSEKHNLNKMHTNIISINSQSKENKLSTKETDSLNQNEAIPKEENTKLKQVIYELDVENQSLGSHNISPQPSIDGNYDAQDFGLENHMSEPVPIGLSNSKRHKHQDTSRSSSPQPRTPAPSVKRILRIKSPKTIVPDSTSINSRPRTQIDKSNVIRVTLPDDVKKRCDLASGKEAKLNDIQPADCNKVKKFMLTMTRRNIPRK